MSNKRVKLSWVILVGWMILIFIMSNQPGEISSKQSDLVIRVFSLVGIELNDFFGELATLVVRKTAHITEYFILYLLAYNVLKNYYGGYKLLIYSLIFVVMYASTDEIHQYFIPGRCMSIKDVCIDSVGGIAGLIIKGYKIKKCNKQSRL